MLLLIAGAPTAHALFGVAAIRTIAEARFGAVGYAHISTLEGFDEAYAARKGDAFIVFIEAPDHRIAQLLSQAKVQIAVFDDGLEAVTGFLMAHHGSDFRSALRYATLSASSLILMGDVGTAVRFAPPERPMRLLSFLQTLCLFYDIEPSVGLLAAVARKLGGEAVDMRASLDGVIARHYPAVVAARQVIDALPDFERRILAEAAESYDMLSASGGGADCHWPPAFCLSGDRLDEYLRHPVELVGQARLLSYGPYLHLPAGCWEVEVVLDVWDNRSGNTLEVALTENGERRVGESFDVPERARLAVTLPFEVSNPQHPIEIYVRTMQGAIEGRLAIHTIRMTRRKPFSFR